jgi:hypothetical protein
MPKAKKDLRKENSNKVVISGRVAKETKNKKPDEDIHSTHAVVAYYLSPHKGSIETWTRFQVIKKNSVNTNNNNDTPLSYEILDTMLRQSLSETPVPAEALCLGLFAIAIPDSVQEESTGEQTALLPPKAGYATGHIIHLKYVS